MLVRRWAVLWLVALALAGFPGVGALAQYNDGLPANVSQVTVDEQPIDASTTPQVATRTPVFAGRLARGTTQVELALGNGEIVRFTLEVNAENGRFRGSAPDPLRPGTYALYVNDALVGNFVVTENAARDGATGDATTGATLDLARMVPYPFDLDEPYPGLGVVVQDRTAPIRYYDIAEQARRQAGDEATRDAIQELRRQYEAAGFRGLYEIRLAVPAEDAPDAFSVQVNATAIEYATAENADAEFTATVDNQIPNERGTPAEVEDAQTIGDASRVFQRSDVATSTGVAYRSATLVFRRDRVIVRVDIADLRNREPELATIEELGGVLVDQVEGALAEESIPLSRQALDLDLTAAAGVPQVQQLYEAVDGNLIPRYLEEQASLEARAASFAGATDVYTASASAAVAVPGFQGEEVAQGEGGDREGRQQERQRQRADRENAQPAEGTPRVERTPRADRTPRAGRAGTPGVGGGTAEPAATPGAGDAGGSTLAYAVTLYAFPDDAGAEAWLAGLPERIDQDPLAGYLRFAPVEAAPSLGDGSAAYSFDRRDGEATVSGVRYYVRLGAEVAALELAAPVEPSLDAVQGLAEAQIACLQAGACPEPAPLPSDGEAEATE